MVTVALLGNPEDRLSIISALCSHFDFTHINISDTEKLEEEMQKLDINRKSINVKKSDMMNTITCRWRDNFVIGLELDSDELPLLQKRPFAILVGVTSSTNSLSFDFLQFTHTMADLVLCIKDSSLLIERLREIDLCNPTWLRPSWDTYFMQMAHLASTRSNCMKRRVGTVLVNDNRVIATGYNGTARGTLNCNQGGCKRCNSNTQSGLNLGECLCLHGEENAILEAGASKAKGATLYCTTAACLSCARKIVQVGVIRMVYELEYNSLVHDSETYLIEAGVKVERHVARQRPHFINI